MSFDSYLKGLIGEAIGSISQSILLDSKDYRAINNLTLGTDNGTTQIDHVIISRFGVFVVEDKTVDGWVFGNANDPNWTIMNWGRKYRIQNPIHQNFKHIQAVVTTLGIDKTQVHSVIVFRGNCEFKTDTPRNVLTHGYVDYIKAFQLVVFSNEEMLVLIEKLKTYSRGKGWRTKKEHVDSLRQRFSSITVCPKCGGALVVRVAKSGPHAGGEFYGCSNYPKCKYTKNADS